MIDKCGDEETVLQSKILWRDAFDCPPSRYHPFILACEQKMYRAIRLFLKHACFWHKMGDWFPIVLYAIAIMPSKQRIDLVRQLSDHALIWNVETVSYLLGDAVKCSMFCHLLMIMKHDSTYSFLVRLAIESGALMPSESSKTAHRISSSFLETIHLDRRMPLLALALDNWYLVSINDAYISSFIFQIRSWPFDCLDISSHSSPCNYFPRSPTSSIC